MNCKEFVKLIEESRDPGTPFSEDSQAHPHMASCPNCREMYLFEVQMRKACDMGRVEAPPYLWQRISARITEKRQRSRLLEAFVSLWSRPRPITAAAVTILAVTTLVVFAPVRMPFSPWGDSARPVSPLNEEVRPGMTVSSTSAVGQVDEDTLYLEIHERGLEFGDFNVGYLTGGWGFELQMASSENPGLPI